MSKQIVNIVDFLSLYNILNEVENLFSFEIFNYENYKDFTNKFQAKTNQNFLIILKKENYLLLENKDIKKNNILIFDQLPLKLEKILDQINLNLIKNKYHSQSKFIINGYDLDLNSRIFSNKKNQLKLTEKEIEIILFLNNKKKAQNVSILQKEVWGHSHELETHTVETHVYRLRKKIKEKFNDEKFIISQDDGYFI
jgi:hypothetical protein